MKVRINAMTKALCAVLIGAACLVSGTANAQHKVRLGHAMPTEHPQSRTMDRFAELVGQYTDGRVRIQVYPGGMLGGDDKMLQATQAGTQEIYYGAVSPVSGRIKALQIFDFPFMFNNYDEVDYVFRGAMGQQLFDMMRPLNVVGLAWGEAGFRQLSNSRRVIKHARDLDGLKIRVMQNPVALETWKAMGTNAVPMSFAEVFTALETKALDGQENPLIHMYANKMYEVQKYITITNHVYTPCALLVSTRFWGKLSPKDQDAMKKAATESMVFHRQIMTAADQDVITKLRDHGVSVDRLPAPDLEELRDKVKPVIERHTDKVGAEFVKAFFAEVEAARKAK
ncbi:MAG: TRAP transporter substrate-binding protein [Rhodocyclaceae bacterium]